MAYKRPGVTVVQEFIGLVPALAAFSLPSVSVGPAFQLVDNDALGDYSGSETAYAYNSLQPGAIVDTALTSADDPTPITKKPIKVVLNNAVVKIVADSTTAAASGAVLTETTATSFDNVLPGDEVVVASGANAGTYKVLSVTSDLILTTAIPFPTAAAIPSYYVKRKLAAPVELVRGTQYTPTALDITIPDDVPLVINSVAFPTMSASVTASYRALRNDLASEVREYAKLSDITAIFGANQVHPANPLGYALFVMLQNTTTVVNGLALDGGALTDEIVSYTGSLDVLELTDMYAIAPLSQSPVVHTMFKNHVEGLSLPDRKLERVVIINSKLSTTSILQESRTTGGLAANGTDFTDTGATFVTNGVAPGHQINILSGTYKGRYKITAVTSETALTVVAVPGVTAIQAGMTYQVDRDLSKTEQATAVKGYSSAIGSRRVVHVWPDQLRAPVGLSLEYIPGFYASTAIAALTTGLPTHQGFTNIALSGFLGFKHSTKYFSEEQLDIIADGGTMVLAQDGADQPLYVRHQLTTDRSAIKFQEYSVTKNVDFIAKFLRNAFAGFIGTYNITDTTLDVLKSTAAASLSFLKDRTSLPKIGGVIRSGTLASLKESTTQIDAVEMTFAVSIPIPLNHIYITIQA